MSALFCFTSFVLYFKVIGSIGLIINSMYAYYKINKCISFQKVVHIVSPCLYILVKQGINDYSDFELYDPTLRLVEVLK
jgi:hypothetical protein